MHIVIQYALCGKFIVLTSQKIFMCTWLLSYNPVIVYFGGWMVGGCCCALKKKMWYTPPLLIVCLPSQTTLFHYQRTSVCVSMMDYISQGCTRHYNPVELNVCTTYHTYLSYSASAESTIIIQCFDLQKVTGCMSGYS